MEQEYTHTNCPVCEGKDFKLHLNLQDHMITKESFSVVRCVSCGFHFTNPIPAEHLIGNYYKSDAYVSHSSSKSGFINRVYTIVRNITIRNKVNLISRLSKGKSLLDIGAGTGHFLNASKLAGFEVVGLEPDIDAKNFAKNNFNMDLDSLDSIFTMDSNSKDVITMWHVLEHVYHLKRDLTEFVRVLKPEGIFIIAVPNMSSWDAEHYQSYWAAYDVPRHLYHFQESSIKKLLSEFDMKCVEILPMKFDAFYVSMLSEKYKGGSFINGIINGLKSNLRSKNRGFSSQIYVFKKNEAI